MWRHGLAFIRFILFLMVTGFWMCVQIPVYILTRNQTFIPRLFHKSCCWFLNIKVHCLGQKNSGQTVYLSNHISWADIIVLGAHVKANFVAKSEVAHWPGFGVLAKIQNTIFVKRDRNALSEGHEKLASALEKGASLILFPEGTNTIGDKVLPFKSSLLAVLEGRHVSIQPICIKVAQGLPAYGWGDVDFFPHLWRFFGQWRTEVEIHFLTLIHPETLKRKEIAGLAEESVRNTYHATA